jgi:hypothetical protein
MSLFERISESERPNLLSVRLVSSYEIDNEIEDASIEADGLFQLAKVKWAIIRSISPSNLNVIVFKLFLY